MTLRATIEKGKLPGMKQKIIAMLQSPLNCRGKATKKVIECFNCIQQDSLIQQIREQTRCRDNCQSITNQMIPKSIIPKSYAIMQFGCKLPGPVRDSIVHCIVQQCQGFQQHGF